MRVPVPRYIAETIWAIQERQARRSAAYGYEDDDNLILTSLGGDDDDTVVAIRGRAVFAWDDDLESVGAYLGVLEVQEEEEDVEMAAPADGWSDAAIEEALRLWPESHAAMTVMPEEEDDRWDRYDELAEELRL